MGWNIRQATAEDLDALLKLYHEYHDGLLQVGMNYELNEQNLPRVLENRVRSRLILTAVAQDQSGNLDGFVFCSILRLAPEYLCRGENCVGYLNDLYVVPKVRRRGLACALTAYAEAWLREQNVKVLELQVLNQNDRAWNFWKEQDMEPVGRICCKYL